MKRLITFKQLLFAACLCAGGAVNGQIHPIAYGTMGGAYTNSNWYKDYVGVRLEVLNPAPVAGDKVYTTANDGTGKTGAWGTVVTTPIVNKAVIMPPSGDSLATTSFPAGYMAGKIGLVYRGGGIEFDC